MPGVEYKRGRRSDAGEIERVVVGQENDSVVTGEISEWMRADRQISKTLRGLGDVRVDGFQLCAEFEQQLRNFDCR